MTSYSPIMGRMGHVDVVAATPLQHLAHANAPAAWCRLRPVSQFNSIHTVRRDATRQFCRVGSGDLNWVGSKTTPVLARWTSPSGKYWRAGGIFDSNCLAIKKRIASKLFTVNRKLQCYRIACLHSTAVLSVILIIAISSVHQSLLPAHAGIVSKRLNQSSRNERCVVASGNIHRESKKPDT